MPRLAVARVDKDEVAVRDVLGGGGAAGAIHIAQDEDRADAMGMRTVRERSEVVAVARGAGRRHHAQHEGEAVARR